MKSELDGNDLLRMAWAATSRVPAYAREDMIQEFCLAALKAMPRHDGRCKESTWAYRRGAGEVATRMIYARPGGKHGNQPIFIHSDLPEKTVLENKLARLIIDDELSRVDARTREIMERWAEGYSHTETAESVGLTGCRVCQIVRNQLKKWGDQK
jgi:DNA-directed RNA polymerase specialized sigma24 family protein